MLAILALLSLTIHRPQQLEFSVILKSLACQVSDDSLSLPGQADWYFPLQSAPHSHAFRYSLLTFSQHIYSTQLLDTEHNCLIMACVSSCLLKVILLVCLCAGGKDRRSGLILTIPLCTEQTSMEELSSTLDYLLSIPRLTHTQTHSLTHTIRPQTFKVDYYHYHPAVGLRQ